MERFFENKITDPAILSQALHVATHVMENIGESVIVTDPTGEIVYVNPAFTQMMGYTAEEAIGKKPSILRSGRHDEGFYRNLWQTLLATGRWQGEIWDRKKSGDIYPLWLSVTAVKDSRDQVTHYVGALTDLRVAKQTDSDLERLAHYDPLTGLANRILFRDRLEQALREADRRRVKVALMMLDLDRFKTINDTMGHSAGDQLLIAAAGRLQKSVRITDTVARLGGDEFAVILPDLEDVQAAGKVARKVIDAFTEPFIVDGREVFSSTSIGITVSPLDGVRPDKLLQNADAALYYAKDQGRSSFHFFSREMKIEFVDRMEMELALRAGWELNELEIFYEPVIELTSRHVVGFEALLGWPNAGCGLDSCQEVTALADETGLIIPIGEWVLRTACSRVKEALASGLSAFPVTVNVTRRQIKQKNFAEQIIRILDETGLEGRFVQLEMSEDVARETASNSDGFFGAIRDSGIGISIDDFGTGCSCLKEFRGLPLTRLKIGKEFVQGLGTDRADGMLVKAVISLAHFFGLKAAAEGVETREQAEILQSMGCDEGQGRYYFEPAAGKELAGILRSQGSGAL